MESEKIDVRLLAKQEIEKIFATRYSPRNIADSYLTGKPPVLHFWPGSYREKIKNAKKRLDEKTLTTLNTNYSKESVEDILFALFYFEGFLGREPVFDIWERSNNIRESFSYFSKRDGRMIKACAVLLEDRFLSATERTVIGEIKARHEKYLESNRQIKARRKEVSLDPLQGIEITSRLFTGPVTIVNNAMRLSQIKSKEWEEAYRDELRNYIFKRPQGKPKKRTVLTALLIVIYEILERERGRLQIKEVQFLIADIASQFLRQYLDKEVSVKMVDNAVHGSR